MRPVVRKTVLAGGAIAVVAIMVAAVLVLRGGGSGDAAGGTTDVRATTAAADPSEVAAAFLRAWAGNDTGAAGALTDDPGGAAVALQAASSALGGTAVKITLRQVSGSSATFKVSWTLGSSRVWTYDSTLSLVRAGDGWKVHFVPSLIHPELGPGERFAVHSSGGGTAVADRDGKPLLTWQSDGAKPNGAAVAPLLAPGMARVAGEAAQGWAVLLEQADGTEKTLYSEGQPVQGPLVSTLSTAVQAAAQAAVDAQGAPAMLVAIQPSTGDLLAVAQNGAAGGAPTALSGLYAPGSTFKIVTAAAALERGAATADTVLPCPGSAQIGQRRIPNDDEFSFAPLPLHSAFAHSCNTTFAQLASGLSADALARAADQFGLNADFTIPGIDTELGKVVAARDSAAQVEDAIGQGTVQASPLGLALMAATVAAGKAVTPKLWHDRATTVNTGYQGPPDAVVGALRSMMREVVTNGTATALQGSGRVFGKTGTAQFGDGSGANGWFAGYRDDVAFAVLLLGTNSSKPAVAASASFLSRLG
ncbi:penicillin-binding transpeptidase domain-containing protein [Amycolatopsis cynarae]|uniref:Penicillin-binding transpeptidase domain-containing protein n=1 Tax=Amycolatopsis cynarae TaxID=2995223 RepID=A0ABY7AVY2_9PSEU|nr:penicillin-binding transpeptidase domain-containing protein [Amycolatopsis sp. HUAS 11-8]WAL63648.1 penicillin-binding transpeptidase domain-containing protein [Amycolatopsis sp. HUAS 11-8]